MPVVTLSAEFVRTVTCPEGKKKENYYDTAITGFILEVRCSGGKTFALRYIDPHGKQIQHKIGDAKDITFDKAKNAAKMIRSRVVLGEDLSGDKKKMRDTPRLTDFFEKRLLPYFKGYKRSWKSDVSVFKNYLKEPFGQCHLDEITNQAVYEFHHRMLAKGFARATCNRALALLKAAYSNGKRWKVPGTEINPCSEVPQFKCNNARERFLSATETQKLKEALEKHTDNPQLKFIIPMLLLTGARKRELFNSRWEHVDLERRIWTVPLSKSGRTRHIPLSASVVAILKQLPRWDGCPYVVPNPKSLQPFTCIFRSWNSVRQEAGLPDVHLHDLRHSMASNMINSGRTIYEVAKVLGHSQIRTTERYSHLAQQTLLDAVNAAADATGLDWNIMQESNVA